jgi:hypothetical protein
MEKGKQDSGYSPGNPWRHAFTANLASGVIVAVISWIVSVNEPPNDPSCLATQTAQVVQLSKYQDR